MNESEPFFDPRGVIIPMQNLVADDYWTKEEKIITANQFHIPALINVSHVKQNAATKPYPFHYHANAIEFHCIIRGQRNTQIEHDGVLHNYTTFGNQVIITYPNELHNNGSKPVPPFEHYGVQIDLSDPSNLLGLNSEFSIALYRQLMNLPSRHLSLNSTQIKLLHSALGLFKQREEEATRNGTLHLICFLFNLPFMEPLAETDTTVIREEIKLAIDYLNANITKNLRLNDLANASGYSLSHFKVMFKEEIGITPAEYLNLQKIKAAQYYLAKTNHDITSIVYMLGFSSASYFSSFFKKYTTLTPHEYRKQYGSKLPFSPTDPLK